MIEGRELYREPDVACPLTIYQIDGDMYLVSRMNVGCVALSREELELIVEVIQLRAQVKKLIVERQ